MSQGFKRIAGSLAMVTVMSVVIMVMAFYDTASNTVFAESTSDNTQEIHELNKQLDAAKNERSELQKKINSNKAQQQSYQDKINNLDGEITILSEQLSLIDRLTTAWTEDLEQTESEISALEVRMEDEIKAFESMLRLSYEYGTDSYFSLIFGSEDIGDYLSRADLMEYHVEANKNIVLSLSNSITELEQKQEYQKTSIDNIEAFGVEQQELQQELEKKSEESRQQKEKLAADQTVLQAQLDAKTSEMNQMEAELKRMYEESKKDGSLQKWDGKTFYIPTENYRISSEFSSRISPITGKRENHNGIDFAAPGGTNIYAAADGKVVDSRYSNSWGNVIQIDHGDGIVTLYAHCSYRAVQVGQIVKRGQVIGKVGSTGWSTGNHLHFTVYKQGVAQNPRNYLPTGI